ncbi:bifunctional metallophosphatase/5'-nucleotidase [Dehalococcoidia bacterium]|nr:bifunctional metallophosphatase/5'-nucleotidase [Dehalococcoidia bacterium]
MLKRQPISSTGRIVLATLLVLLLAASVALPFSPRPAGGEAEIYFTVLHTNDEESALLPHSPAVDFHPEEADPTVGGFARLAYLVGELRAIREVAGESVVLLGAGDFIGGSPHSWLALAGEAPELALMQEIGYDVITIGNHDFDYGTEVLALYLKAAGYPQATATTVIVASNIEPPANHPLAAVGIQKTFILELENGLRLGFLGLLGEAAERVALHTDPIDITDPIEAAVSAVQTLKDNGAEIIIAISHSGVEEDSSLAAAVEGIDIIVGGHSHTALYEPLMVNDTIIVQAGVLLRYLGVLELAYNPTTDTVRLRNRDTGQPFLIPIDDGVPLDQEIRALIDIYTGKLNTIIERMTGGRFTGIMDTVATSTFPLPDKPPLTETTFGNFIADAMRLIGEQKTGERVDFAIQADGNIRGSVIPGSMPHSLNQVSFFDLVSQVGLGTGADGQPGYPLVSFYLTGDEMRRVLEISSLLPQVLGDAYFMQVSGLRYTYDPGRAILFWIPIKNLPFPTYRAVLQAERFTGEGVQGDDPADYVPLSWGDETLYHVVTDYYIASFIPMVGDMLPRLTVTPKDRFGNEVSLEDSVIIYQGAELKVWQAVLKYAAAQPAPDGAYPQIPEYYAAPAGRINQVQTIPLLLWPALAVLAIVALIIFLLRRRRRGRAKAGITG